MQTKDHQGKFESKSLHPRYVRSIRATDACWDTLGEMADREGITRADLLERWVQSTTPTSAPLGDTSQLQPDLVRHQINQAIALLEESLALKANAGGSIKAKVKEALERLGVES